MVKYSMEKNGSDGGGLGLALAIAKSEATVRTNEEDAKILRFFLQKGECTAEISEAKFSVWYSWLPRLLPSHYFTSLAPGVVQRLMELGELPRITDEATFQVGPRRTGTGKHVFDFENKWVRIQCEEKRIVIRVRNEQKDLYDAEPLFFVEVVRCERCNGELRTPLAKQCLHCGFDWH